MVPRLGAMPRQVGVTIEGARSDNNPVSAFAERTGDLKSLWMFAEDEEFRLYIEYLADLAEIKGDADE